MKKLLFIDTDLGGDCDDVGALALANIFHNKNFIEILGMTHTTSLNWGWNCIDIVNHYYGNDNINVGVTSRKNYCVENTNRYAEKMVKTLGDENLIKKSYPNSIKLMRETLSKAENGSVTMVFIGQLANASDLLDSLGDEISLLSGVELVKEKVKEFVIMGGLFKEENETVMFCGNEYHSEYNIVCDIYSSKNVVKKCPVPIIFSDFKVGYQVHTGGPLLKEDDLSHPVTFAYKTFQNNPRESWDLLAVWYAALGCDDLFTISNKGIVSVLDDGTTIFKENEFGNHYYLRLNNSIDNVVNKIDNVLKEE